MIIPEGVTVIKKKTFAGCSTLRKLVLPKSVEGVEEGALEKCEKLSRVFTHNTEMEANEDVFGKKIKLVKPRKKR